MKLTHVDAKGNYTGEELVRRAITVGKQRLAFLDATMASGGGGVAVATWACPSTGRRCSTSPSTSSATRGDLVWTQCSTCLRKICAKQTLSYYNSSASSSFAWCRAAKSAANDIHFCDLGGGCSFIASSSCVSPASLLDPWPAAAAPIHRYRRALSICRRSSKEELEWSIASGSCWQFSFIELVLIVCKIGGHWM